MYLVLSYNLRSMSILFASYLSPSTATCTISMAVTISLLQPLVVVSSSSSYQRRSLLSFSVRLLSDTCLLAFLFMLLDFEVLLLCCYRQSLLRCFYRSHTFESSRYLGD